MAKKVGKRGKEAAKSNFVMVIKKGRARIEKRDEGQVVASRRVSRRNRYKG